jgi:hypothetical protein
MGVPPKLRELWQQLELEVVATIFIIAASSFLFLKLVSEVREGETHAADEAILLAWGGMGSGMLACCHLAPRSRQT